MRWLLKVTFSLLTLAVAAVAALILLVPSEKLAEMASDRVEAATGRTLSVAGAIRPTVWPHLGLRAEGVTLSGPAWGAAPTLTAEHIVLGLDPVGALRGEVTVAALEVVGATVTLETRADGAVSWDMAGAGDGPATGAGGLPSLSIPAAALRDATLRWIDHAAGRDVTLTALDVDATVPDLDARAHVRASALLEGRPVRLDAEVAALMPFLGGALSAVDATLASGGTTVALTGRADLDPAAFDGGLTVESTDRFAVLEALGMERPALPRGLGAGRAALSGTVTIAPAGTVHLRDAVIELDSNRLAGGLDLDPRPADRPRLAASLSAPALDLSGLAAGGAPAASGWSTERIDVSGLFALDGRLSLASGPVTLPDGLILEELRTTVTVERGRAVAALQPVRAFGGTATGDVVVNGRGGLSARANVDVAGVDLQAVLSDLAGVDRILGTGDLSIRLLGVGNDVATLMGSLDGTASVRLGPGAFEGFDLVGMIRNLDAGHVGEGRKTIFDGLTASWAVADGVARGRDLAVTSEFAALSGEGTIDLGARRLDYRLLPRLKAGDRALEVPVTVRGPWDDPSIRPDLERIARAKLEEERERLEARAKAEIEEKMDAAQAELTERLASELEVPSEALTGREAVEGAIAQRVEAELRSLLLGGDG